MNFKEFLNEVTKRIREYYPNENVEVITKIGNNGVIIYDLLIGEEHAFGPILNMDDYFDIYNDGTDITDIVGDIVVIHEACKTLYVGGEDKSLDFAHVKDNIVYYLVNAEKNKEILKEKPHVLLGDCAICFQYILKVEDQVRGFIEIDTDNAIRWGVDEKELLKCASANTPRIFPFIFCDLLKIIKEVKPELEMSNMNYGKIFVLTSEQHVYGAATILYEGILGYIAKYLKKDYFLFFNCIDEILVIPVEDEISYEEQVDGIYKNLLNSVAKDTEWEKYLSDDLFYYTCEKKELIQIKRDEENGRV